MAGAALVGVCAWALTTAWGALAAGHPSYLIFYGAALAVAVGSISRSLQQTSPRRVVRQWFATFALVLLAATSFWLRPFTADEVAVDALDNPGQYVVTSTPTAFRLDPTRERSDIGLIFQPGARVDARAYAAILSDIADLGHPVVIVKQPLGIGFLALGSIADIVEQDPNIAWVAAGHSLGGVAAAEAAEDGVAGLVFWAAFPAGDISGLTALDVISIYGTADGLATEADLQQSASRLPATTTFVPVDGAIHSFFGDYGVQPGDGTPGIDRVAAQMIIVAATNDLLERVQIGLDLPQ